MKNILFFFFITFALLSCKKEKSLSLAPGSLIETREITSLTKNECIEKVRVINISSMAMYDVQLIELVYATEYQGKTIETSGILFMPIGKDSVHFVNYNHGTVVPLKMMGSEKNTPSLYSGQKDDFYEVRNFGLTMASSGYAVFMPDYVGYNRTKDKEHPYIYYPELYKSIRDGNNAAKAYFHAQNKIYDNRIFIAGWSQGGGASLATHRYLQEKDPTAFDVVASFNLSGPYNFKRFIQSVFEQKEVENKYLSIYGWALYSMNKFSELKRPNDRFFSYPVTNQINAVTPPSTTPIQAFNLYFIKQIVEGTDTEAMSYINQNTQSSGWVPNGKVYLYHGTADDIVPYFNSEDCYNNLYSAGADIHLATYEGDDHFTVFAKYLKDVKLKLDQLK